jgi:ribulose 1,5-bisphosphate synthetase/thiazole synthase
LGLPNHLDDKAMSDLDAIIVGAGHNGLTCAAYLGMAGLRVRVFERRSVVGPHHVRSPLVLVKIKSRSQRREMKNFCAGIGLLLFFCS